MFDNHPPIRLDPGSSDLGLVIPLFAAMTYSQLLRYFVVTHMYGLLFVDIRAFFRISYLHVLSHLVIFSVKFRENIASSKGFRGRGL